MAAVVAQTTTSLAPKHPAMQRAQARREDQHEQRPDLVYARLGTPYGVTSLRRPPASRAAALAGLEVAHRVYGSVSGLQGVVSAPCSSNISIPGSSRCQRQCRHWQT
jgi:hypothetical protein